MGTHRTQFLKMKTNRLLYLLPFILLFSSCWKEDLKNCWMGDVTLTIAAEKFQQPATDKGQLEDNLSARISSIRYYLYKDNTLVQSGIIDNATDLDTGTHPLSFPKLAFGEYCLGLVANASEEELSDTTTPEALNLNYPGAEQTKDYFTSCYDFTVDCECGYQDFVILRRTQAVTQFQLKQLPENITGIAVEMHKVAATCQIDTLYKGETIAEYHTTVTEATNAEGIVSFNIGTFPTTGTENASIILKLYADGKSDSPVYQNTLNNVRILRNQLTRISTDFNYTILGNSGFSVTINPDWDGTNNDDETIIP